MGEGIGYPLQYSWAPLVAQMVKNLPAVLETSVRSLDWEDPWRQEWIPIPVIWSGEFHGQRSLAGYRPWGPKESDMTEQLSLGTITINRSLNYPWVCHFHPFTFNTSVCLERTSCKQHIAVLLIFTEFDIISFNSAFTMIVAQLVKNLPAMWEIWVQSLGWEDPLEKGVATYFQYSGLENSMDHIVHGSQRVGHD